MIKKKYEPLENPIKDLDRVMRRMAVAIENFSDEELKKTFTFQWGEKTTISGAIIQNLVHAAEHFSQLRERAGILKRNK